MKRNHNLCRIKGAVKHVIYVVSILTACYGFWGCLFPDLTLVEGTYRFVRGVESEEVTDGKDLENQTASEEVTDSTNTYGKDAEALYADILGGKVKVTYRSKIFELLKYKCGLKK